MINTERNYIFDLGQELVGLMKKIDSESSLENNEFQRGRRFNLYEILSIMKQQAEAFGLSDQQIGLDKIDVESLLK